MSQTDTLVFVFLSVVLYVLWLFVGYCEFCVCPCTWPSLSFFLSLSFSVIWSHSYSVYFYECLQYLMEAKKAQQSLESTYKQLDSVSLKEASIILDVSCWMFFYVPVDHILFWVHYVWREKFSASKLAECSVHFFKQDIFFHSKNRWTERKSVPHFRLL